VETIRSMSVPELKMVLGWAAEEGWNPGLDDAAPFYAADRAGFLLKLVDGAPAAAISVVNHSDDFAFLGLYICRPEFRGRGHGLDIWRAGLAHAGDRCVGLDGVQDQQGNYERSGFKHAGETVRFMGTVPRMAVAAARPFEPADLDALRAADQKATGISRAPFLDAWFAPTETRRTLILTGDRPRPAYGTIRRCGEGAKIGPLAAGSREEAAALLSALVQALPADPVFVDIASDATEFRELLESWSFVPVFGTARMYLNGRPETDEPPFWAGATLELG
jgi:hypothetical protein